MAKPVSQTEIERAILTVLKESAPYLVGEKVLFSSTSIAVPRPIVRAEFDAALSALLAKEPAQVFCSPTDDGNKWKLTAAGEARLGEL